MRRYRYEFIPVRACAMCGSQHITMLGQRLSRSQGFDPRSAVGLATGVKRCVDCGLIFSDPRPIPASLDDHYDISPDDYWTAGTLRPAPPDFFAYEIETARRLLPHAKTVKALDVGAGFGRVMHTMSAAGFDAWGIEPGAQFRELAISRGVPADRLNSSPMEEAKFPDASFDFVSLYAVLEHLQEPAQAIERGMRWLKPGGILHVEVPSSNWLISKLANLFFRMRATNYVTNISPLHPPYHLFEFTLESFKAHGRKCGYEIAESKIMVCTVFGIPKPLRKLFAWWMDITGTGMQLIVWLRKPN
jgi:SAM-dependent methyltransferase